MATTSIPPSRLNDTAAVRLVCLPYAGGGSAAYHRWRPAFPRWVDLVPLALPGHDGRLHEPPSSDLRRLASALVDELKLVLDRPFALFGCSMGAWLAFEMAGELGRRGDRLPAVLVVAASPPPHATATQSPLHRLPDDELVAAVQRRYGGIPAAICDSPELLQLLLPALRADLQMVETYQYAELPPLETPILALGGTEDPDVSPAQLADWRRHTARDFSMRLFPGGHFFLFQAHQEQSPALRMILAQLERFVPTERRSFTSPIKHQ